mmetsp:Transcript_74853/g.173501  ORF Transcript_74853/g.173501 Transcript_74853/m.173501 type:complete len:81 (+) Transcript_74853:1235-1477(+)
MGTALSQHMGCTGAERQRGPAAENGCCSCAVSLHLELLAFQVDVQTTQAQGQGLKLWTLTDTPLAPGQTHPAWWLGSVCT